MTHVQRATVMLSHFRLHFLFWLLLCSSMNGCYVDTPSGAPDMVSRRLLELLADPAPDVRRTAAEALGKVGHRSANSGLIAVLNDQDAHVRAAAALSLGRLGDGASGVALVAHLADSSETVRGASALALGEIELSAAREAQILEVLHHPETSVRIAASRALLGLDTVSLSVDLVGALRDSHAAVRQGAAGALGETGEAGAIPHLLSLLRTDMDAGVRSEAAFRLGKIGNSSILAELSMVASADSNMVARGWARWAVQQITQSREFGSGPQPSQ